MRYEVWYKYNWGSRSSEPKEKFATLDTAMLKAAEYSKDGEVIFLLDKGQNPSVIRGFGMNGKFVYAVDCKKCDNAYYEDNCPACKGASWKHIRTQ